MYFIIIYMKEKFVNIKIREEYRDLLKNYSRDHGYKMYALLEELIKDKCRKKYYTLIKIYRTKRFFLFYF